MVRFKNRWLLLSIDTQPPSSAATSSSSPSSFSSTTIKPTLSPQIITRLLRSSLALNFGDVASGAFGGSMNCKYYSHHTGTAIVRCPREGMKYVWAACTLACFNDENQNAPPHRIRIRVIHCGGTIKKVQIKAMMLDEKKILGLRRKIVAAQEMQSRLAAKAIERLGRGLTEVDRPEEGVQEQDLGDPLREKDGGEVQATNQVGSKADRGQSKARSEFDAPQDIEMDKLLDEETKRRLEESRKQISSFTQ
ncbi:hypothetical protein IE53DRAFT_383324 [Violaceomyces palustris]|uniref:Uncharacterized protein n=1 Tax=Violaceomyces palustris TaxID=1673888 RepID=A0ACD0P7V2_9BASI|nr:hypothetical protein IE53DRAFT_383324 [Violaceomyces palustris]